MQPVSIVNIPGSTYIVNIVPEIEYIQMPLDISANNYYRQLNTIIYENNYYLTAGNNNIFYSTNGGYLWYGTAFDSINTDIYGDYCDNQIFVSLAYSGNKTGTFMAVANNKTNVIIFKDPINRDFTSVSIPGASSGWNSVAYGNGMFIGVGNDEWFIYNIATSNVSYYNNTNSLGNYTSMHMVIIYLSQQLTKPVVMVIYIIVLMEYHGRKIVVLKMIRNVVNTNADWTLVKFAPLIDGGYFSAFASGGSVNYTDSSNGIY